MVSGKETQPRPTARGSLRTPHPACHSLLTQGSHRGFLSKAVWTEETEESAEIDVNKGALTAGPDGVRAWSTVWRARDRGLGRVVCGSCSTRETAKFSSLHWPNTAHWRERCICPSSKNVVQKLRRRLTTAGVISGHETDRRVRTQFPHRNDESQSHGKRSLSLSLAMSLDYIQQTRLFPP